MTLRFGDITIPVIMQALKCSSASILPVTKRQLQEIWLFLFHKLTVTILNLRRMQQQLVSVSAYQINSALILTPEMSNSNLGFSLAQKIPFF